MVLSKLTKEQTPSVMCVLPVSGVKQTYDPALARLFSSSVSP